MSEYLERQASLQSALRSASTQPVRLEKKTSNLFRDRSKESHHRLDVSAFDHVLEVDTDEGWVDVEGMTPYDVLVEHTLAHGVMPCVVPQLKSITIGGALAGIGIESSSFRYGLTHETLLEFDVLLGDGSVVTCSPRNQHRDLFFGFPNSYGTLGYALRIRASTVKTKPYVALSHHHHHDRDACFAHLRTLLDEDIDFLDGAIFGPNELVLSTGRFVDEAPYTSDYSFENIYFRSQQHRTEDFLTVADYLWRWDTDWFWCSKNIGAQNPVIRRMLGRKRLNSRFYTRVMRWNSRWQVLKKLERFARFHRESVIQDIDVPLENAGAFLEFFHREIGVLPIWICPVRTWKQEHSYPLFPVQRGHHLRQFRLLGRRPHPHGASPWAL